MARAIPTLILLLVAIASSVAVVVVQHERRHMFVELRGLERVRDDLEIHWDRLRLERSALTANDQVEQIARERLGMHIPAADSIVLVTP